jgi:tetratricopeptide (TPR) repeat protein
MPDVAPLELFISHAPEDLPLADELDKHLALLERQGHIVSVRGRLAEARIVVVLVSADYLASDLYEVELGAALARRAEGVHVLGVLSRPASFGDGKLADVKMLPVHAGKVLPVTEWTSRDAAFAQVAEAVRELASGARTTGPSVSRMSINPFGRPRAPATRPSLEGGPKLPRVWNVPHMRSASFAGRADELDRLHQGFARRIPRSPVQAIHGLGGIGKTALALEYVYRFAHEYDVVGWVRSGEAATLAADLADLAVELGLPGSIEPDRFAALEALRRWLTRANRWLLVFDGVREPRDLYDLLPPHITGHVLVTSRHASWAGTALPLPLRGLKRNEAVALLLGREGDDTEDDAEDDAARELAAALSDLPLALAQAAAYMDQTGTSVTEYLQRFRDHRARLLRLGGEGDHGPTVATTWAIAFRDVRERSPAAGELLDLCAFLAPEDIPRDALPPALVAAAGDPLALDDAVKALRRWSLVDAHEDALAVHPLVQAAVRDGMAAEDRVAWARRAIALVADRFPSDADDPDRRAEARSWLPHVRAVLAHAPKAGAAPDERTLRLLRHAAEYERRFGFDGEARELLERAVAVAEGLHGRDHPEVAGALRSLGLVLRELGDLPGALRNARRALAIHEACDGATSAAAAACGVDLASLLRDVGQLDEARRVAERALAADEALGPDHATAVARDANALGSILRDLGELAEARACFTRALAIVEEQRPRDLALRLNNLGLLLREMGELDEALDLARRALDEGERARGLDDPEVATYHSNLACVLQMLGRLDEAREHLERALAIGEAIYGPEHHAVAIRRNNLGLLLMELGDLHGALREVQRAVEIAKKALGSDHRRVKMLQRNRDEILRRMARAGA